MNSSLEANIQEIAWGHDPIEDNCVWLIVSARKPFAYAAAAMARFAQQRQADLERKLRLAKEYWLRIQPFIIDRPLRDAELYVATDAHRRMQTAHRKAALWNVTAEGKRCPLPADALVDFTQGEFREPEELCRDESLKPETLATIAAPMMQKRTAELTPLAAVGVAHELLMAAGRYVNALPEQKRGIERLIDDFDKAFSTVTFPEIEVSNKKSSGQLPLLPPEPPGRNEGQLSLEAFKVAALDFLKQRIPNLTKEQYERDQEQTERLAKEGKLFRVGTHQPMTYQEWQSNNQKAIDDCTENNRISLQALCELRWERFIRFWDKQHNIASTRQLPQKDVPDTMQKKDQRAIKLPESAASTPMFAGKREKGKSVPVD